MFGTYFAILSGNEIHIYDGIRILGGRWTPNTHLVVSIRKTCLTMAMDEFFVQKLDSMQRTFNALTERLADPDIANNRFVEVFNLD